MSSSIFETPLYKIQITGKTAWVEACEGQTWVLKSQHVLPVSDQALNNVESALHAAVQDVEHVRQGDTEIRSLLKLQRPSPPPRIEPRVESKIIRPVAAAPPARPKPSLRGVFRGPLRPPIRAAADPRRQAAAPRRD